MAGLRGLRVLAEGRSLGGSGGLLGRGELLLDWRGSGQVADLLVDVLVLPVVSGVAGLEALLPVRLLDFELVEERDDVTGDAGEGASFHLLVYKEEGPSVVNFKVISGGQLVLPPIGGFSVAFELFHGVFNQIMINLSACLLFNDIEPAVHLPILARLVPNLFAQWKKWKVEDMIFHWFHFVHFPLFPLLHFSTECPQAKVKASAPLMMGRKH